jgi:hypothetical protein
MVGEERLGGVQEALAGVAGILGHGQLQGKQSIQTVV